MAHRGSTGACGLKIFLVQPECYRHTGVSGEFERQGIHSLPRPDFTQPARTTAVIKDESKTK